MTDKIKKAPTVLRMNFNDNNAARTLFGPGDQNLKSLEEALGVEVNVRGNEVSISGDEGHAVLVERILRQLYRLVEKGHAVGGADVKQAVRLLKDDQKASLDDFLVDSLFIPSRKKLIYPRSAGQKQYLEAMAKNDITFGIGPAGTGKTYLAVAMAVSLHLKGAVKKIILTRPALEAGEKLGFLPGDLAEKINPYLRPLFDSLHDMIELERIQKMTERGEIEVAPLAFMRGRTLHDAYVILDEAQNCTVEQMKMFLTRMGPNSKTVVTGDVTQVDLPSEKRSGLVHALEIVRKIPGIHIHHMDDRDVVRHPLVREIIKGYDASRENGK